jgi:hypothetical protein
VRKNLRPPRSDYSINRIFVVIVGHLQKIIHVHAETTSSKRRANSAPPDLLSLPGKTVKDIKQNRTHRAPEIIDAWGRPERRATPAGGRKTTNSPEQSPSASNKLTYSTVFYSSLAGWWFQPP